MAVVHGGGELSDDKDDKMLRVMTVMMMMVRMVLITQMKISSWLYSVLYLHRIL